MLLSQVEGGHSEESDNFENLGTKSASMGENILPKALVGPSFLALLSQSL